MGKIRSNNMKFAIIDKGSPRSYFSTKTFMTLMSHVEIKRSSTFSVHLYECKGRTVALPFASASVGALAVANLKVLRYSISNDGQNTVR